MSDWNKVENPVEKTPLPDNSSEVSPATEEDTANPAGPADGAEQREQPEAVPEAPTNRSGWTPSSGGEPSAPLSPVRYTGSGRRRGRRRLAAPLGFLVLALAVIGLVSLVLAGLRAIERSQDDTALREELTEFLTPVMLYEPDPFDKVNDSKQDALIQAAVWKVTEAERIRQLRENTDLSVYAMDDMGRMLIPLAEVEKSYHSLFGPDAKPYHHTIGDPGMSFTIEYDPEGSCYHVPTVSSNSLYVPVLGTIKKKGNAVTVEVGYVLSTNVGRDEKGELVTPPMSQADKRQLFTLNASGDGWMLSAVANVNGGATTAATTTNPTATVPTEDATAATSAAGAATAS